MRFFQVNAGEAAQARGFLPRRVLKYIAGDRSLVFEADTRTLSKLLRLVSRCEAYSTLIDLKIAVQLHSRAEAFAATDLTIRFTTES